MINEKEIPYFEIPVAMLGDKNIDKASICICLYGLIKFLCNDKGFCAVSNKELANYLECNINEITNGLRDLSANGYIYIKMVIDDKQTKPIRMICIKEYYEKRL